MKADIPSPTVPPLARQVLKIESDALLALADRLDVRFAQAIDLLLACRGRVVVTGMGKSGHIGRKIAATLASTGTPAFFVHPGEASHGDLGMITSDDVVIALSYSGESQEITSILPLIKRRGAKLIGISGKPGSTLGRESDIHLDAAVDKEACPHNLAPTASTTAALALGDALAICLLDARGFSPQDFAMSHPGGSLGRRLLVHVRDVMHSGEALPRVDESASLQLALLEMTRKGLGMTAITDAAGRLRGVFTDGDLRRALEAGADIREARITTLMSDHPKTIGPDRLAAEAVEIMQTIKVNGLLVVSPDQHLLGALNMHDLLRAGVV
jgi:arabinose-5-phosphate isomerase